MRPKDRKSNAVVRPGKWAVIAVSVVLIYTLIPSWDTMTSVLYCVLGPILCFAFGSVASVLPGSDGAVELIRSAASRVGRLVSSPSPRRFCAWVAGLSFTLAALFSLVLFDRAPGVFDGAAYLLQAKILASGAFAAGAPALPEFVSGPFMVVDGGRWYSQYPPGFPLVLAVGAWLGLPWLVNPVIGGATAILVYLLAREFCSELESRVASILAGLSPLVIFMASDLMSHVVTLFFVTAFMLSATRYLRRGRPAAMFAAGVTGGLSFCTRPYSAIAICLVFSVVCLAVIVRRRDVRAACAGLLGAALPLLFFMLYNTQTTGDPFLLGYMKIHDERHVPAAGISRWRGGLWYYLLRNSLNNLNHFNRDFLQMPFPGFVLAAALFVCRRPTAWEILLLLSMVSLVAFYFVYRGRSSYLGPRFLFEGVAVMSILSARGLLAMRERFRGAALSPSMGKVCVLSGAMGVLLMLPVLAMRMVSVARISDTTVVRAVESLGLENAVVFVPASKALTACLAANSPTLDGRVVYAVDLDERNDEFMRLYPQRTIYCWSADRLILMSRSPSPGD